MLIKKKKKKIKKKIVDILIVNYLAEYFEKQDYLKIKYLISKYTRIEEALTFNEIAKLAAKLSTVFLKIDFLDKIHI